MSESSNTMVYLRRDADGRVVAVSRSAYPGCTEASPAGAPEVVAFLQEVGSSDTVFRESDLALIRVIEDLIDVLIRKEVLRLTDFPDTVQAKLLDRRKLRRSLQSLNLLGDDRDSF